MTNQAQIQSHINKGFGIAAKILGVPYQQYRATVPTEPAISPQTLIGSLNAGFDVVATFPFEKPTGWGKEAFYGLFSLATVLTGDYLVGQQGTFLVSTIEPLRPALCVFCNSMLSAFRPPDETNTGNNSYGGMVRSTAEVLLAQWPATVLRLSSKVARGEANLPEDPHYPWWEVYLPNIPGFLLESGDLLLDADDKPYNVSSVEKTQMGIRITTFQATT